MLGKHLLDSSENICWKVKKVLSWEILDFGYTVVHFLCSVVFVSGVIPSLTESVIQYFIQLVWWICSSLDSQGILLLFIEQFPFMVKTFHVQLVRIYICSQFLLPSILK